MLLSDENVVFIFSMRKSRLSLSASFATTLLISTIQCAATDSEESEKLFTSSRIPELEIRLAPRDAQLLRQEPRRYVKATVIDGDTVFHDVGMHLKGGLGSFRPLDETPCLTLSFNKFGSNRRFHGLGKFHLNNSVQDETYMTELICGELFRRAGIPAPRVTHAKVRLNGRELGLYVLIEAYDEPFLRRNFSDPTGNLYDGGERTDIVAALHKTTGNGLDDRSDLNALAMAARSPVSNRLERLGEVLDLDRFYSFLAMEILTCHWDGYAMGQNNYRIYNDPSKKRLVFLPHGMDQMFGRPTASILPDCRGLVAWAALSTPEGRRRHLQHCSRLFSRLFSVERLTNEINVIDERIRPTLVDLGARFLRPHDLAVKRLRENIVQRIDFLSGEFGRREPAQLTFSPDGVAAVTGWRGNLNGGEATLDIISQPDPVLRTRSVGEHVPFFASWRTRVLLAPGHYRFVARIRAERFAPIANAPGGGIFLRAFGLSTAPAPVQLTSEFPWRKMQSEFVISGAEQEVELIIEIRALRGTVWADHSNVELVPN